MCSKLLLVCPLFFVLNISAADYKFTDDEIVEDLLFGVSTSAYQTEGAWNEDGKTLSVWDIYTHNHPEKIKDRSNADITCDSYHQTNRDLSLLKELGVDVYRISLAWTRILPTGFANVVNDKGIKFYRKFIGSLLAQNVTPIVTLFHWDLPQSIQVLGGWQNELIVNYITDYAKVVFDSLADLVPIWMTINEPYQICKEGYGDDSFPPAEYVPGISEYLCNHNVIKANARIYHLYDDLYRDKYKGLIGMSAHIMPFEPLTNNSKDVELASAATYQQFGWSIHPIHTGDYPEIVKETLAKKSRLGNFPRSRLPEFSFAEQRYIRGTYDFIGLNYYLTPSIHYQENTVDADNIGFVKDFNWNISLKVGKPSVANWINNYPDGLRKSLLWVRDNYDNPLVLITEIGCPSISINNEKTIDFLHGHISAVFDAIKKDNCNVRLFSVWTLMDNFEWARGYTEKFGFYETDFNDSDRKTRPRSSAKWYKNFISQVKAKRKLSSSKPLAKLSSKASSSMLGFDLFSRSLFIFSILTLLNLLIN